MQINCLYLCMENLKDTPTPTIAELWGRLQFKAAQERDRESGAEIYPDKADNWRAFAQKARDEYAPIRHQLVERCALVGLSFRFLKLRHQWRVLTEFSPTAMTANDANEIGSALLFAGWELKQREKEAANGN